MILTDLAKYPMTWSIVRLLCDIWASSHCNNVSTFYRLWDSTSNNDVPLKFVLGVIWKKSWQ